MESRARERRRAWSTPAERAEWVRRYEQAGLSQRTFAREHDLGLTTLQRWLAQARKQTLNPASSPAATAELWREVSFPLAPTTPVWAVEIARADGLRVSVNTPVDAQWLAQLWRGLTC